MDVIVLDRKDEKLQLAERMCDSQQYIIFFDKAFHVYWVHFHSAS